MRIEIRVIDSLFISSSPDKFTTEVESVTKKELARVLKERDCEKAGCEVGAVYKTTYLKEYLKGEYVFVVHSEDLGICEQSGFIEVK
jgi:TnpA family transposase